MSVDSLESGENVIEFLLWGCFKKSVCFSTVGDGIENLMGENIFWAEVFYFVRNVELAL